MSFRKNICNLLISLFFSCVWTHTNAWDALIIIWTRQENISVYIFLYLSKKRTGLISQKSSLCTRSSPPVLSQGWKCGVTPAMRMSGGDIASLEVGCCAFRFGKKKRRRRKKKVTVGETWAARCLVPEVQRRRWPQVTEGVFNICLPKAAGKQRQKYVCGNHASLFFFFST